MQILRFVRSPTASGLAQEDVLVEVQRTIFAQDYLQALARDSERYGNWNFNCF
jgi:hypothetical protein